MRDDHDREIAAMFDRIAARYDVLNRVLSFGTDVGWRRRAMARAGIRPGMLVADVGAGTGDLSFATAARGARVLAIDLSPGMLAVLDRRAGESLRSRIRSIVGSAEQLPLPDASVDRIVTGFTVRNIGDRPRAFREFRRVLRPSGRLVVLELSHPPRKVLVLSSQLCNQRRRVFPAGAEQSGYVARGGVGFAIIRQHANSGHELNPHQTFRAFPGPHGNHPDFAV